MSALEERSQGDDSLIRERRCLQVARKKFVRNGLAAVFRVVHGLRQKALWACFGDDLQMQSQRFWGYLAANDSYRK